MKQLIISYKNRTSVMSFLKLLRMNGVSGKIINTPHKISSSCSLSISTDFRAIGLVSTLVRQSNLSGFLGLFSVVKIGAHEQIERLM